MGEIINENGLFNLGNSVVLMAVNDYRWARFYLRFFSPASKRYAEAEYTKDECERFFLSDWFNTFTLADGKAILDKLNREEVAHRSYYKF